MNSLFDPSHALRPARHACPIIPITWWCFEPISNAVATETKSDPCEQLVMPSVHTKFKWSKGQTLKAAYPCELYSYFQVLAWSLIYQASWPCLHSLRTFRSGPQAQWFRVHSESFRFHGTVNQTQCHLAYENKRYMPRGMRLHDEQANHFKTVKYQSR